MSLYSLVGAICALDGCIVNISGITLLNNYSVSTYDGGENVPARLWELREKVKRACDLRFSMIKAKQYVSLCSTRASACYTRTDGTVSNACNDCPAALESSQNYG